MKKSDFDIRLRTGLQGYVAPAEVDRIVAYYDEMLLDTMEDGTSEDDAVAQLGDPGTIVYDAIAAGTGQSATWTAPNPQPLWHHKLNWPVIILLVIGSPLWGSILLAGLGVLLAAEICLWCIPFTGLCLAGGFGFGGIIAICASPFAFIHAPFMGLSDFGVGIALCGVAIIAGYVTYKLGSWFLKAHTLLWHWLSKQFTDRKVALA